MKPSWSSLVRGSGLSASRETPASFARLFYQEYDAFTQFFGSLDPVARPVNKMGNVYGRERIGAMDLQAVAAREP